jgi:hypothetical protein
MRIKRWFYTIPLRLRSLFRRRQIEQELDEELRYHLERQIEELIAKGVTEEEARYMTRRLCAALRYANAAPFPALPALATPAPSLLFIR